MKDMKSIIDVVKSIEAQAVATTINGVGVDLQGFESATFVYDLGTFGGTGPTATLVLEDSPDNSVFIAVPATDLEGVQPAAISAAADQLIARVGYKGNKRYVRAAVTAIGGTAPSLPMSASVIRARARHNPLA